MHSWTSEHIEFVFGTKKSGLKTRLVCMQSRTEEQDALSLAVQ